MSLVCQNLNDLVVIKTFSDNAGGGREAFDSGIHRHRPVRDAPRGHARRKPPPHCRLQRRPHGNVNAIVVVSHTLPNGNMVVEDKQEMRVNFETRELTVAHPKTATLRPHQTGPEELR
jgi:hypothetical protein